MPATIVRMCSNVQDNEKSRMNQKYCTNKIYEKN